jgi:chromosome partitioning protein
VFIRLYNFRTIKLISGVGALAGGPVILSCVNLKGGVGKTTLAVNFAAYCGMEGLKTLLIDLDPQTNATFACIPIEDWQKHAATNGTVAHLLGVRNHTSAEGAPKTASDVIIEGVFENVDLIPSHLDLFTVDLDLGGASAREQRLKRALRDIADNYDVIICDCPPNLTIPTQNALALSTHYVVPVSPDFLSSLGIGLLLSRVQKLSDELDNPIVHAGIVISRIGRPSLYRSQTIETLRESFSNVFDSTLTERSSVSEATAKNRSVFETTDRAAIAEFTAVSEELANALGFE